jgi:hypothetical protein
MWKVNLSAIPSDLLSHTHLLERCDEIQNNLSDPSYVRSICIHECAHAVYWKHAHRKTKPDYNIRVYLDPDLGFVIEYAATVLVNLEERLENNVLDLAKVSLLNKSGRTWRTR